MLYLRNTAVLACALLAGCASVIDKHPKMAYADKKHPLSDTAIFSCADIPGFTCGITRVDEVSTWNHYNGGKTVWVRVLPGQHQIGVIASNGRAINWLSFDIKDVQAGHAYSIEIANAPPLPPSAAPHGNKQRNAVVATMSVSYKDLGKMDSYTIEVGKKTFHPTQLTASF